MNSSSLVLENSLTIKDAIQASLGKQMSIKYLTIPISLQQNFNNR